MREYVPLEEARRELAAKVLHPPILTYSRRIANNCWLEFCNSAGQSLLLLALLINFDMNKLGKNICPPMS